MTNSPRISDADFEILRNINTRPGQPDTGLTPVEKAKLPNPEAEAVRNALEKAAEIAENFCTKSRQKTLDETITGMCLSSSQVMKIVADKIAQEIRALIPAQDSKQPEPS